MNLKPDREALKLIPKRFALENKVVPISVRGGVLTVAMADPDDLQLVSSIESMTNLFVEPVRADEEEIIRAIEEGYEEASARGDEEVTVDTSVVALVDSLIARGIRNRATDIHIEPEREQVRTRYRIDGLLQLGPVLPKEILPGLVTRIKIMANMNISERRLPQDGGFSFSYEGREVDIRVSTLPTIHGEKVVMRILDKERIKFGLEYLGFSQENLITMRRLINRTSGIILVTGPTGSGKTTTLYSALSELNTIEKNIITLEDPVEYELPSINQTQINPKAGLTFASGLRSILRQDPDIIMVGEIRDSETLEVAIRAALTGHLVLSTLHANSAAGAIPRLLNMGAEPFLLASSLIGVIAQRLVRVICEECKEEDRPRPELLRLLGLDEDEGPFYRGRGCESCNNTGYKGRTGIFEILVNSKEISELIMRKADSEEIEEAARRAGMRTMIEDGLQKAKAGITTLEEIVRVVSL
ncbi:type II secretion system protein GspE [Candidatus Poribacteria bacterium]|nr:MAG: type II secretion system protein GspE [Candidatus Poribacteria bacterium]